MLFKPFLSQRLGAVKEDQTNACQSYVVTVKNSYRSKQMLRIAIKPKGEPKKSLIRFDPEDKTMGSLLVKDTRVPY